MIEGAGFINPIQLWNQIGDISTEQRSETVNHTEASLFGDVFRQVVNQVGETQKDVEEKQYLLATGQLDDMHTLPIAEAKAALSLEVMISMRNKAMEAYNELMRISI